MKDCTNSWEPSVTSVKLNCPGTSDKETCAKDGHDKYFCEKSKTCIETSKLCDGIVHCIYGEDEGEEAIKLDYCRTKFPQSAIKRCKEKDRLGGYNIWINAIPCNKIQECENVNSDEGHWYCDQVDVSIFV